MQLGQLNFVLQTFIAGIVASFACGMGVLPLAIPGVNLKRQIGLGYALAGGLMFAASVYNLLMPAFAMGNDAAVKLQPVLLTLLGMFSGCGTLWCVQTMLTPQRLQSGWLRGLGGRMEVLVFLAMTFHSIPEGVAVGVGYGAEVRHGELTGLGWKIAVAIAIHNIPEGLAVALPLRAGGASLNRCFWLAFLTSLPQPIAAVPASLMVWLFEPLMLPMLGFAAGAMMYLVVVELIPDALESRTTSQTAWAFMIGFGLMVLVQVVL